MADDSLSATPNGKSVIAVPPGRLANDAEAAILTEAENTRRALLTKAIPLVSELLTGITMGDSAVTLNPRGTRSATTPGLEVTKRAAAIHLGIYPNTYDWLNDPADKKALDTITVAARLLSENLALPTYNKWVIDPNPNPSQNQCGKHQMARNEGQRIVFQLDYFTSSQPPMPSTMCVRASFSCTSTFIGWSSIRKIHRARGGSCAMGSRGLIRRHSRTKRCSRCTTRTASPPSRSRSRSEL
jgi:hypothetical protein